MNETANTTGQHELTPDQLKALAVEVTRLMASNAEPEAEPVPSADAPDAHMERMSTAVKVSHIGHTLLHAPTGYHLQEHVHMHVCVALGVQSMSARVTGRATSPTAQHRSRNLRRMVRSPSFGSSPSEHPTTRPPSHL